MLQVGEFVSCILGFALVGPFLAWKLGAEGMGVVFMWGLGVVVTNLLWLGFWHLFLAPSQLDAMLHRRKRWWQ